MLKLNFPLPVKPICAIIYSSEDYYNKAKLILLKKFGSIDFESEAIDFVFTDYYHDEMGLKLWRKIISFKKLISPHRIVDVKLFTIKIEKKFARDNKRIVNIDPGYINEAKLVLATTKDFSHRIYLGRGIFAEVTLRYDKKEGFVSFSTTFPDYKTPKYHQALLNIRNIYCQQIKPIKL